ncbi:putative permease YjgP/YjgQ [Nautilia profundicola AmH]|uniref:Permease YjgP/YjgQ n=1 Tax=Nautilia profundicola (strain ATCC BAA-1463 / DSM 18972 / AmH) TaxID=598659 RepID=B9LAA6_NAUPA|nr:LptF/LptG family permease [Nautilia profundicola]ACM93380.1 putative permease YjgP/YjgQ [Nautilia profundicola AmH]
MDRLSKYLISGFWPIFIMIFLILFLVTSIIIIISIANITANIHITFGELFKMYMLSLPKVLFITLSISFFISAVSLFAKHSETQELIALFSSGVKPYTLLKPFLFLSLLLTIVNLLILFISIPYAKVAFKNFKNQKQQAAKFNFQTSQISQRFGNWNIFTSSKKGKTYENIILYNNKENQLILAKYAELKNKNGYLNFELKKGNVYAFDKSTIINFGKMQINQKIPKSSYSIFRFSEYFKKFKELFAFYLPFALLPLSLIFFIPPISFFHPRIYKNRSLIYAIALIVIYLVLTKITSSLAVNSLICLLFFIVGYVVFKRKTPF